MSHFLIVFDFVHGLEVLEGRFIVGDDSVNGDCLPTDLLLQEIVHNPEYKCLQNKAERTDDLWHSKHGVISFLRLIITYINNERNNEHDYDELQGRILDRRHDETPHLVKLRKAVGCRKQIFKSMFIDIQCMRTRRMSLSGSS